MHAPSSRLAAGALALLVLALPSCDGSVGPCGIVPRAQTDTTTRDWIAARSLHAPEDVDRMFDAAALVLQHAGFPDTRADLVEMMRKRIALEEKPGKPATDVNVNVTLGAYLTYRLDSQKTEAARRVFLDEAAAQRPFFGDLVGPQVTATEQARRAGLIH